MTEKLYERDSHIRTFQAEVLSCEKRAGFYETVLDRTAFFPEGGGQGCDFGTLADAAVLDVQLQDGVILHKTDRAVPLGTVSCTVDFARRLRHMQNHSGEHILSGLIHRHYGLDNVGFHLGEEVTADFNGILTRSQLDAIETLANEAVFADLPVTAWTPPPAELAALDYRSKAGIEGEVRLVKIGEVDLCACCAPHVKSTGEIGLIKVLDFEKNKGGTRIRIKCGKDALLDYRAKYTGVQKISNLLAVKQNEVFDGVEKLNDQLGEAKWALSQMKKRLIAEKIKTFDSEKPVTALFEEDLDGKELQLYADALHQAYGGIRAVFSGADPAYSFAACGEEAALNTFFGDFKNRLTVRGGGRNGIVQGTVQAERAAILAFFDAWQP